MLSRMKARFVDRRDAGQQLATALAGRDWAGTVVLGLPRGGVPVATEIADRLDLPMDILVIRKLGYPGQPELAVGAIGERNVHVLNNELLDRFPVPRGALGSIERSERRELERSVDLYRRGRQPLQIQGKSVIVTDDGMATGSTMLAAVEVVRSMGAARVTVAIPVASSQAIAMLSKRADEVISVYTPRNLRAVGLYYEDFTQVEDREVTALLAG